MDILIGTRNQYKVTEMAYFLEGLKRVKIHFLVETEIVVSIDEDQATLKANAEKKALEISKQTDWYVIASDGGVDIPGSGDKWNILKNQRTVGENNSDKEKVRILISLMDDLKGEDRRCSYRLALALARKGQLLWSFEDISDVGYIIEKPEDSQILPYRWMSHVWYYPQYKKTLDQLDEIERKEIRRQGDQIKEELHRYFKEIIF